MLGIALVSNDGKVTGSYKSIKLGLFDGKGLGNILGNVDGNTLGFDVGIELGSLIGSLDGYNYDKLKDLFIGDSLGSTNGKVIDSD